MQYRCQFETEKVYKIILRKDCMHIYIYMFTISINSHSMC